MIGLLDAAEVRRRLADACREAGSAKAWAAAHGCSGSYLHEVLVGTRDPGPKILEALGLEKVVGYRRIALTDAERRSEVAVDPSGCVV